jgi:hypothetical protein
MKRIILAFAIFSFAACTVKAQSCCGGSFYDIAVLPLDKKALFNAGVNYDNYNGVWDNTGTWKKINYTAYQIKPVVSAVYRFNSILQAGASVPFVYNRSELPGLQPNGAGIGDITVNGRFEIFHEFQRYKSGKKYVQDTKKPYLAVTFGVVLPTGRSDETATTEAGITGKGFFMSSLGFSVMKTIIKDKFQIALDLGWQHSFEKNYEKVYGVPISTPVSKQLGEKLNYGLSFNYLINYWNAASLSLGGFTQGAYKINGNEGIDSDERSIYLTGSYTYYPIPEIRITPSFKWNIPSDNLGKNAPTSLSFVINGVYYIEL